MSPRRNAACGQAQNAPVRHQVKRCSPPSNATGKDRCPLDKMVDVLTARTPEWRANRHPGISLRRHLRLRRSRHVYELEPTRSNSHPVRAGELNEAYAANDNDSTSFYRDHAATGAFVDEDLIWDAKPGTVTFQFEEEAALAVPPPSGIDGSSAAAETNTSSGHNGASGSDNNPLTRTGTGQGSSERSSISDQPTLVISPPPS
jgi:hypothetical protein